CIAPENGAALAEAVLHLKTDTTARQAMGKAGRNYVELHFAREAVTGSYRTALEHLIGDGDLTLAGQTSLSSE
ncbi:MAG TPA: hypothetical protein PKD31_17250, partial [Blastocatellia bacterium]|nr:hypothetical protein [Blastocatellia bacterium]